MKNPEITIGLPVRNGEEFLKQSLNSILSQTFQNFELIISDNASTDKTREICKKYLKKDRRIVYNRQRKNLGSAKNFIFVLNMARSKYFIWASDDDFWAKNFLSKLKAGLDKNNECGVAMTSVERRYVDGKLRDKISFSGKNSLNNLNCRQVFGKMIGGYPIHIFIYGLFRTKTLKALCNRGFPDCIASDRVLMCEAALYTRFFSVSDLLYKRTVYKESIVKRYSGEKVAKNWSSPRQNLKYALTSFNFLISSKIIPIRRKFWILFYWLIFAWKSRNLLIYELFSTNKS